MTIVINCLSEVNISVELRLYFPEPTGGGVWSRNGGDPEPGLSRKGDPSVKSDPGLRCLLP